MANAEQQQQQHQQQTQQVGEDQPQAAGGSESTNGDEDNDLVVEELPPAPDRAQPEVVDLDGESGEHYEAEVILTVSQRSRSWYTSRRSKRG